MFLGCLTEITRPTRKLPAAGKEGLDVVFMEAVAPEHPVEPLEVLEVALEGHLLLPPACDTAATSVTTYKPLAPLGSLSYLTRARRGRTSGRADRTGAWPAAAGGSAGCSCSAHSWRWADWGSPAPPAGGMWRTRHRLMEEREEGEDALNTGRSELSVNCQTLDEETPKTYPHI